MRRRAMWAAKAEEEKRSAVIAEIESLKAETIDLRREWHDALSKSAEATAVAQRVVADVVDALSKNSCPKCGKEVRRGMHFHQKYCKGPNGDVR